MRRRITRFEIGQTTKMMVGFYALIGVIFGVLSLLSPTYMPGGYHLGFAAIIVVPIFCAIWALIAVPIFCVIYNFVAKYLGGIEINSEDSPPK